MSDYTLRNVAPGPIGQMPVSELEGLSGKAGAAGQQSGSAFRQALMAELDKALADTRDKVQNLLGALTFTARPSIQPNVQAPAATPGKGVSFNRVNDTLRAAHADYGFETV
jgi:hypothetical protein